MNKDKHGKHKESCKKYAAEGRRERNKAIKQERHEKRMAYFAKRREEKIGYEYDPDGAKSIMRQHKVAESENSRAKSKGELRKWLKAYGKLDYEISVEKERARSDEIEKRKNKKSNGVMNEAQEAV